MLTYEEKLDRDVDWALQEGGMYFDEQSEVHHTMRRISKALDDLGVEYVIVGGMAMFLHGYRRFTEDVDVLVDRESLSKIHDWLGGRGYLQPFEGSKNLRDTQNGVRVEFLISGQYPGDGKPGPISFPLPQDAGVVRHGVRVLAVEKLVELKLASGTTPGRRKDLGDVQELMRMLDLPLSLKEQIDPSVQDLYVELWSEIHPEPSE